MTFSAHCTTDSARAIASVYSSSLTGNSKPGYRECTAKGVGRDADFYCIRNDKSALLQTKEKVRNVMNVSGKAQHIVPPKKLSKWVPSNGHFRISKWVTGDKACNNTPEKCYVFIQNQEEREGNGNKRKPEEYLRRGGDLNSRGAKRQ